MTRDYRTLDAIVVILGLLLTAAIAWSLAYREIPQANLPILASMGTGVLALVAMYCQARWGNKRPSSEAETGSVTVIPPAGTVTVEPPAEPKQ